MEELCKQIAQVLFAAECDLQIEDYKWAFNRAIVNCCMTADEWTQKEWNEFENTWKQFKQRGVK